MLGTATGLRLVGEASSGIEALQAMGRLKPDIVLMDVHMPGMDGAATTAEILAQHPAVKRRSSENDAGGLFRICPEGCGAG
jgi:DNA-binding NarL/FixJ family response regulator